MGLGARQWFLSCFSGSVWQPGQRPFTGGGQHLPARCSAVPIISHPQCCHLSIDASVFVSEAEHQLKCPSRPCLDNSGYIFLLQESHVAGTSKSSSACSQSHAGRALLSSAQGEPGEALLSPLSGQPAPSPLLAAVGLDPSTWALVKMLFPARPGLQIRNSGGGSGHVHS